MPTEAENPFQMISRRSLLRCMGLALQGLTLISAISWGQSLPILDTKTSDGKSVQIPDLILRRPSVLVFGFSKAAAKEARVWDTQLINWQAEKDGFSFYNVVMLSRAPRLTHGLISRAITASIPKRLQNHVLFASSGDEAYRSLLNVGDRGKAYVALCDSQGRIVWHASGAQEGDVAALRIHLRQEINKNEF